MPRVMSGFFSAMFVEMGARRRRLRAALGDRGQGLAEFLLLGGLLIGSLGLFVRPWMPAAAPWGFAIPVVFLAGYALIEARRQSAAMREGVTPERLASTYDWGVLLWCLACMLAGAAAFIIAWGAAPVVVEEEVWTPPEGSIILEMTP